MRSWSWGATSRFGQAGRNALFVTVALVAAFTETMSRRDESVANWASVGAITGLGAIALWWRRPYPVATTAVGLAVVAATGLPIVLFAGLFTCAVRRRDSLLVVMTAVAVVVLAVRWSVETDDGWIRLAVSAGAGAGLAVVAGAYVGARRELIDALRERAERAEADQEVRAEQARLAERSRIAREMHDVVAHKVCLIAMQAGALEVMSEPTARQVATSSELIRTTANEAMEELRDVLGVLAPSGLGRLPAPRRDDIVRVVEASRSAGAQVVLHMEVEDLPDAIARAAHRTVSECLTNVHKHAPGAATSITVSGAPKDGLAVEVVNGRAAGTAALVTGAGIGLLGVRERILLLGGTFEAGRTADGGWRLAVWMPWIGG